MENEKLTDQQQIDYLSRWFENPKPQEILEELLRYRDLKKDPKDRLQDAQKKIKELQKILDRIELMNDITWPMLEGNCRALKVFSADTNYEPILKALADIESAIGLTLNEITKKGKGVSRHKNGTNKFYVTNNDGMNYFAIKFLEKQWAFNTKEKDVSTGKNSPFAEFLSVCLYADTVNAEKCAKQYERTKTKTNVWPNE